MFTEQELIQAIRNNDYELFKDIIENRDEFGFPLNINDLDSNGTTALHEILANKPVNRRMLEYILSIRDSKGELVIDINKPRTDGLTILEILIDHINNENEAVICDILNVLLGIKKADGSLAFNLRANLTRELFCNIVAYNKAQILKTILGGDKTNNPYHIDVNMDKDFRTPLDYTDFDSNTVTYNLLRNCGAKSYRELVSSNTDILQEASVLKSTN